MKGEDAARGAEGWRAAARRRRARRALVRQLAYQREKSAKLAGSESACVDWMESRSRRARALLEEVCRLIDWPRTADGGARVLEVGSGAHGLIFFFGGAECVGVDPLAVEYASLFPAWQRRVRTVAAYGESLPFADASFDVVLSDNVVDHAERPARIVSELARVLRPGGLLYFTVNVHHPLYALASALHAGWNSLGVPFEIAAFADHTVHLTPAAARRLFAGLPLRLVREEHDAAAVRLRARRARARHAGDLLKRVFFKNALYEVVAVRAVTAPRPV